MYQSLLTLLFLIPLLAALIIALLPQSLRPYYKIITTSSLGFSLACAIALLWGFDSNAIGYQFYEKVQWFGLSLGSLGKVQVNYELGVDGISAMLVFLSALILLIGAVSSWEIDKQEKGFYALYLLLSASIFGCFIALDFFLFYVFFEFMLLPMYFLIGLWGGPKREYASIKFFLYTLAGSLLILLVMIALSLSVIDPVATGQEMGLSATEAFEQIKNTQGQLQKYQIVAENQVHTFSLLWMNDATNFVPRSALSMVGGLQFWGQHARLWAFLALLIGFAIKLPSVPFHTWLPDAHVEAPTSISVVLAGVLLKIGAYGIIRFAYGIFPEGALYYSEWIAGLGVLSILYGALNALAMKDLKKMVAYSSVSHMGYVLLGLATLTIEGVSGAVYQMISHGFISPLLFLLVGVLYLRTHNRSIEDYRGLASRMPVFTFFVIVAFFASSGLPGLAGFIGEILIYLGAFKSAGGNAMVPYWMALLATLGLVLGAAYYLWTLQRMFFGAFWTRKPEWEPLLGKLSLREYLMFVPLLMGILLLGIFPSLILDIISTSVGHFVESTLQVGEENLRQLAKFIR
ncbi:NADH-quinone oxidoreductase subunit M [Cytophagales bacterium LB-30]|uniref:NADH-quinone oxidoreductase subunit M n=1 Tax=Shiella aurantiaca TaxID=3058365 RepID=A0ABT8FAJ7_9BACT|nr:NADH-quinone oxidoreductase subunit M [Shiella aurantiaca]MDN4167001.1 NADH-quinone oxidoreductase subunit M [Shiella aurantiaca]